MFHTKDISMKIPLAIVVKKYVNYADMFRI